MKTMPKIYLSVIIPCYNEAANLKRGVLREVYDFLKKKEFNWEVLISDDGSSDESREIVKREIKNLKNFRLLENPHGGKPSALGFGIKKARGEYILFTDMDQSTPIRELNKLLPFTREDYGAIIGSRGLTRKDFPWYRKLGAIVFAAVRKTLILREITDTQCGFKLFKRTVVQKAFPKLEFFKTKEKVTGWKVTSYDVELLYLIKKMGERIKEVVVSWQDRDISKSKGGGIGQYVKESKEMLVQILRVKLNQSKGLYD
jgi:dolichyl-phosphate beta-glucosyltransferase